MDSCWTHSGSPAATCARVLSRRADGPVHGYLGNILLSLQVSPDRFLPICIKILIFFSAFPYITAFWHFFIFFSMQVSIRKQYFAIITTVYLIFLHRGASSPRFSHLCLPGWREGAWNTQGVNAGRKENPNTTLWDTVWRHLVAQRRASGSDKVRSPPTQDWFVNHITHWMLLLPAQNPIISLFAMELGDYTYTQDFVGFLLVVAGSWHLLVSWINSGLSRSGKSRCIYLELWISYAKQQGSSA